MSKLLESCAAVKMESYRILAEMVDQRYKIDLWADGCADVHSPRGEYSIEHFVCNCPDATHREGGSYTLPDGRKACRHVLAIIVARPCEFCRRRMILDTASNYFECPGCGNARDARIVKAERKAMLEKQGRPVLA